MRKEVLDWLIPRRPALLFLGADLDTGASTTSSVADFSKKELTMISEALGTSKKAHQFWATCLLCIQLANWGASVSRYFHSCPLASHFHSTTPCKNCQWKGRMAVRLAQGSWIDDFSKTLLRLTTGQAPSFLTKLGHDKRCLLERDYGSCRVAMIQRFQQVFSFWRELPWRICAVGIHLFDDITDDPECSEQYIKTSKLFAQSVIEQWDNTKVNQKGNHHFQTAKLFLDETFASNLRAYIVFWASSSEHRMPDPLAHTLMKYCSALTVMQSLEAQHHYLAQRVSFGRASLPAATCAYLRRRTNGDLQMLSFRKHLNRYLGEFSKLVAIKWDRRSDT